MTLRELNYGRINFLRNYLPLLTHDPYFYENGLIPDLDSIGILDTAWNTLPPDQRPSRFDRVVLFTSNVPTRVPDLELSDQSRRVFHPENANIPIPSSRR